MIFFGGQVWNRSATLPDGTTDSPGATPSPGRVSGHPSGETRGPLAAIIPPSRRHVTVYSGVLSSRHLRRWIVPGPKDNPPGQKNPERATPPEVTLPKPRKYILWHELLRSTLTIWDGKGFRFTYALAALIPPPNPGSEIDYRWGHWGYRDPFHSRRKNPFHRVPGVRLPWV